MSMPAHMMGPERVDEVPQKAAEAKEALDALSEAAAATGEQLGDLDEAELVAEQLKRLKEQGAGAAREMPMLTGRLATLGRGLAGLAGGPIGLVSIAAGFAVKKFRELSEELEAQERLIEAQARGRDEVARRWQAEAAAAADDAREVRELSAALEEAERLRERAIGKIDEHISKLREEAEAAERGRRQTDALAKLRGQEELEAETDPVKRVEVQERLAREQEARERENLAKSQAEQQAIAEEEAKRARRLRGQQEADTQGYNQRIGWSEKAREEQRGRVASREDSVNNSKAAHAMGEATRKEVENAEQALAQEQRDLETIQDRISRLEKERDENAAAYRRLAEEAERRAATAGERSTALGHDLTDRTEQDEIRARIGDNRVVRARRADVERRSSQRKREEERAAREAQRREELGRRGGDIAEDAADASRRAGVDPRFARTLEEAGKRFEKDPTAAALESLLGPVEKLAEGIEKREGRQSQLARQISALARKLETLEGQIKYSRDGR